MAVVIIMAAMASKSSFLPKPNYELPVADFRDFTLAHGQPELCTKGNSGLSVDRVLLPADAYTRI